MDGGPGAESTQARTRTVRSHYRGSTLCLTSAELIFGRVPVFFFASCPCLDQVGARFGLGLARGL